MMLNLTQAVLHRPLTIRQWEAVNAIEEFVHPRFRDQLAEAEKAKEEAERAYVRTLAEVSADPRYQALISVDTKQFSAPEYKRHTQELAVFEQRLRTAETAKLSATNRYDDLNIDIETAYAGTCLLAGEISGFRMGLQVFASMLTAPDRWGVTGDRPAAAVIVDLMTNDERCLETIHQLMGDVVYTGEASTATDQQ